MTTAFSDSSSPLPHAVVLAGGQGERLGGVRKAEIRVGRVTLLDRVTAALGSVTAPLLVSTGPGAPPVVPDGVAVADLNGELGGPLAGLAAAVDWLAAHGVTGGMLVSVAVDTPFLPDTFIEIMLQAIGSNAAAYACWGEPFYPTNAIWRLEALAGLPGQVRAGTAPRSLKALLAALGATAVDWRQSHVEDPFANLNTPADLVALGRRAARETG